jgi:hypothetical protein
MNLKKQNPLKMQNLTDAKEEVSEIQIRHKLGEIDNDHAKVQLFAVGLFLKTLDMEQRFNKLDK